MTDTPSCPKCQCDYTYHDGQTFVCPECAHEWQASDSISTEEKPKVYQDAYGNILQNGDTVILTQNLKVKGTSSTIKTGTKVKNIRLVEGDHDIDCKVDGIGPMKLKTQFVKKV